MPFTHVLLGMTLLVVVLGTADTLAASVLDRTREIGTMRAIGMPRRHVAGMLLVQSVAAP